MFTRVWAIDTVERVLSTAIQAGLGVVVASGANWIDVNVWQAAGVAAIAAALSALKAAVATKFKDPESASLVK